MSKKILVFSASGRKGGNTDILCDQFIKGAVESGHEVEKIYVAFENIRGCLGCRTCRRNGGKCVQPDDMAAIYEKLLEVDAFVMASPIYFYSFNAQMKAVMDRTFAIEHILKEKKAYLIVTGDAPTKDYSTTIVDNFRKYLSCFPGVEEGGIVIACGTFEKGDVRTMPAMQEAYETGKNV